LQRQDTSSVFLRNHRGMIVINLDAFLFAQDVMLKVDLSPMKIIGIDHEI